MYDIPSDSFEAVQKENVQLDLFVKPTTSPFLVIFLWSALLSVLSVVNPLLTPLANNLQSQNLYAGWAMAQGEQMYSQIYGTSGLLFYALNWLGNLVMGNLLLALFQFLALFVAGLYLFKLVYQLTRSSTASVSLLSLFYLLTLCLGFGGLYSSLFAFPFVFWGLYFVLRYVADEVKDSAFIGFGAMVAVLFFIHPLTSLFFYGATTLVLMVYNIILKRKARGFYQFLAGLLGFSLVFYPIGYYTVWQRSFGMAISQILYPWDSLMVSVEQLIRNGIFYGALLLGLGFVIAWIMSFLAPSNRVERTLQLVSFFASFSFTFFVLFSPEQGSYHLLVALPYLMVLLSVWLKQVSSKKVGRHSRAKRTASIWSSYFSKNLFLPVLALTYLLVYTPVQHYILSSTEDRERIVVSTHIRENAQTTDKIYTWDKTAHVYQMSGHVSAISLLTPTLYQGTNENRLMLDTNLRDQAPVYLLVHNEVPLTKEVEKQLKEKYSEQDLNLRHFRLYQLQ